jgi:inward rectifier potassium channel
VAASRANLGTPSPRRTHRAGAVRATFALLYVVQAGAIVGAHPGSLADGFFFSVQTMATVGRGQLAPQTINANSMVTAETLWGMLLPAVTTGLAFARFSWPTARATFSRWAVIAPYSGVRTLSMPIANEREDQIPQAEVGLDFSTWRRN